ncbi:Myb-like_DNA-binding domain-containing protein [Hexamita inflata]|uniref:Myb-like_DNA-binding domain-containing protein n=1 Tax=Hexamita inflata TaxID=28002 RepID=A0ABP1HEJ0_9EUKA
MNWQLEKESSQQNSSHSSRNIQIIQQIIQDTFCPSPIFQQKFVIENPLFPSKKDYHNWTQAEEDQLQQAIKMYGKDWKRIQKEFYSFMTPTQIKNKFYTLMKRAPQENKQQDQSSENAKDCAENASEGHQKVDQEEFVRLLTELHQQQQNAMK